MPTQIIGSGGTIADVDGAVHRAQRVSARPLDHGSLGAYAYGGLTGVLPAALAANSEIYQFRWSNPTNLAIIRKVRIAASVSTTMFAAGVPVQIGLFKCVNWTVQGTLGTGVTIGSDLRRRTDGMGTSLMAAGDMRIATTAALGGGTKTVETNALSTILSGGPITASLNGTIFPAGTILWQAEVGDGEHPLVLKANEGFVVRSVAVPATGTWMASMTVDWTEVVAY